MKGGNPETLNNKNINIKIVNLLYLYILYKSESFNKLLPLFKKMFSINANNNKIVIIYIIEYIKLASNKRMLLLISENRKKPLTVTALYPINFFNLRCDNAPKEPKNKVNNDTIVNTKFFNSMKSMNI